MVQRSPQDKLALLRQHEDGVTWAQIAATSGVPVRTLARWAAKYRTDPGSAALHRPPRPDRGTRHIPGELIEAIEALALRTPPPTIAFIYRRVSDIARDRGLTAPSYSSVRSIIAGIDPGLRTLARHGDAAYRDHFELVFRRTAANPNEQWQADHTLLDVMILDASGAPVRPWLTVVLDDYSRAITGYTVFLGAPTAEQTALALHQAVNRKTNPAWAICGLPDILYSDHGSDFTSARLEQVCLDTHTRLIHSRVGVPQGRGKIERFYGTITTELLPHLPGHIPHGTNGQPISAPTLNLHQLDKILERFIVQDYNQRPHSQTGQTPAHRWSANGFIPRSPARADDLDLLLLTAATTRKVQRDGIQFASTRYISPVLAAYVAEQVTVRFNPRDVGEIRVYHNNAYLCRAIAPELASTAISLQDLQAARTARRRDLKNRLRQRRSLADALPTDTRHTAPATTPEHLQGLQGLQGLQEPADPDDGVALTISTDITDLTGTTDPPTPRHGLRLYATD